jgi:hypothetical protein
MLKKIPLCLYMWVENFFIFCNIIVWIFFFNKNIMDFLLYIMCKLLKIYWCSNTCWMLYHLQMNIHALTNHATNFLIFRGICFRCTLVVALKLKCYSSIPTISSMRHDNVSMWQNKPINCLEKFKKRIFDVFSMCSS